MPARLTIHLSVSDGSTRAALPCRVQVREVGGASYAPLGRPTQFPFGVGEQVGDQVWLDNEPWYYVAGSCEITLPTRTPLRLRVSAGPNFRPIDRELVLAEGQMTVRLALDRVRDIMHGWTAVEGRCHELTPHAAALQGAAEGLKCVNLLAWEVQRLSNDGKQYPHTPNLDAFSGQDAALERHGVRVVVNTYNRHSSLGAFSLLNCHREVLPLTSGDGEHGDDLTPLDWIDQCRRKKGLAVWSEPFSEFWVPGGAGVLAALLGTLDAVEITSSPKSFGNAARLWNSGLTLPVIAASGKRSNREILGRLRTLVRLDADDWVLATRAGRTLASNGAGVEFSLADVRTGGRIDDMSVALPFRVTAFGCDALEHVELVHNDRVIARRDRLAVGEVWEGDFAGTAGWIAVRCMSENLLTTPIWISRDCQSVARSEKDVVWISHALDRLTEWAENGAIWSSPLRKAAWLERVTKGRDELQKLAGPDRA